MPSYLGLAGREQDADEGAGGVMVIAGRATRPAWTEMPPLPAGRLPFGNQQQRYSRRIATAPRGQSDGRATIDLTLPSLKSLTAGKEVSEVPVQWCRLPPGPAPWSSQDHDNVPIMRI